MVILILALANKVLIRRRQRRKQKLQRSRRSRARQAWKKCMAYRLKFSYEQRHLSLYMCSCLSGVATTTRRTKMKDFVWYFDTLSGFTTMFVFTLFHLLCGAHCQFLLVLLQSFDYDTCTTHTTHTHIHTRAYSCQTPTQTGAFIVVSVSSLCNSIAVACLISIELLLSAAHTHTHRHTCTHTHACCNAYLTVDLTTFPKWLTFGSCTRAPAVTERITVNE